MSGIIIEPKKEIRIPDAYKDATSREGKPSGFILMNDEEIAVTQQCCHCGHHFVMIKGSGTKRGFCMRCMKVTCGQPGCDPCIPFEEKIIQYEMGNRKVLL